MKDLAETIQKWDELRRQETGEIVEKILQEANRLLEERIDEGNFDDALLVHYDLEGNFEVEVKFAGEVVKKAQIPFPRIEMVSAIIKRLEGEFKAFSQLEVIKKPLPHKHSKYDVDYLIIVQLKS